jgi:hypothetical protein
MVAFVQLAHGVSIGREDLPIPVELFNLGAAVVLILSFLGLAVLWRRPQLQEPHERTVAQLPRRPLAILSGLAGVGLFGLLVYFGLFAGCRRCAGRPGACPLRRRQAGHALPVLDADRDGRLHQPGAVPAQRLSAPASRGQRGGLLGRRTALGLPVNTGCAAAKGSVGATARHGLGRLGAVSR